MRKFWRLSEATVGGIEHTLRRIEDGLDHFRVKRRMRAVKNFRLGHSVFQRAGRAIDLIAPRFEGVGNRQQHAAKTWPARHVGRRVVSAAEERLAVGREKTGERPTTLP